MKQHSGRMEKHSTPGISNSIVPLCANVLIDNGAWLDMEQNMRSSTTIQGVCKKDLVSLIVTLEEEEDAETGLSRHRNWCIR
ncbi:MAG: hypothetical protein NTV68_00605 [Methanomicrobiales archaeon]|nr:hypothetical protein [Methanomicrobiales archaeon]